MRHLKPISTTLTILLLLCGAWGMGRDVAMGPNLGTQLKSELNRLLNDNESSNEKGVSVEVRFRVTESSQLEVLEVVASDDYICKDIRSRLQNAILSVDKSALGRVFEMTLSYKVPNSPVRRATKKKLNS